jgi:hypothetical protein
LRPDRIVYGVPGKGPKGGSQIYLIPLALTEEQKAELAKAYGGAGGR